MMPNRWAAVWTGVLWLALAPAALAQREPRIGYVYPAGGQQGTTLEATLGGQSLDGTARVLFSGTGLRASVLRHDRQLTPKEQDEIEKRLYALQQKRRQGGGLTAEEERQAAEIRVTLTGFGRRLSNPALNEFVTIRVEVAPDAEPGPREIRLGTPIGLSNPLAFHVGRLPEVSRKDWKNIPKARNSMDPELDPSPVETRITLPVVLNGQIQPGGAGRYRFRAEKGRTLAVVVSARELNPYLADAVPGWFQAALALYDTMGKELAYRDDDRFHPDPVLFYESPADGDVVLEIRDALRRGREDFVYRVAVGELPFVTGLFPLGGPAGSRTTVTVSGWNLAQASATVDLRGRAPGILPFSVQNRDRDSNRVPFGVDTLPEILEREPNDSPDAAQSVGLPVIINGRLDRPGDVDVFRVEGRAGSRLVAEVMARRLGSVVDSTLRITDDSGRQIAFNDDHADKGSGLDTHHADSCLLIPVPSDGPLYVHLADAQGKGGPANAYRLRLSAPRPDFELRVVPSTVNVRAGACAPITVFALRRDGYAGPVALSLKDAPAGFALAAAEVPAGRDRVTLTISAPPEALPDPLALRLEGRAAIGGSEVVRAAVPADDRMQAFAYRHLVPAQEWTVAVWGRSPPGVPVRILTNVPVRIQAGGTARVEVAMPVSPQMGRVEFEPVDAPDGIVLRESAAERDRATLVLQADAEKVKPGTRGALVLRAFAEHSPQSAREEPSATPRRVPLGALPAIPFEVVER
jgi:hypothetical protein